MGERSEGEGLQPETGFTKLELESALHPVSQPEGRQLEAERPIDQETAAIYAKNFVEKAADFIAHHPRFEADQRDERGRISRATFHHDLDAEIMPDSLQNYASIGVELLSPGSVDTSAQMIVTLESANGEQNIITLRAASRGEAASAWADQYAKLDNGQKALIKHENGLPRASAEALPAVLRLLDNSMIEIGAVEDERADLGVLKEFRAMQKEQNE